MCCVMCVGDGCAGTDGQVGGDGERDGGVGGVAQLHQRARLEVVGRHLLR